MKTLLTGVAACALLAAAPKAAWGGDSVDYQTLVQVVQDARAAWEADPADPDTSSYWADLASTLPTWTDIASTQRARLERAIDDLTRRAKNAQLELQDFWKIEGMIIDAKCCSEVRKLWRAAKGRNATRAQFEYVASLLEERAEAAKEHPDLRQLLQDGIKKLMRMYLAGEALPLAQTNTFDDAMVRSMLDRAVDWLEDKAVERKATREQFEYVRDLMKDRARIWSEDLEFQALVERVEAELDRLLDRALSSQAITRDEFMKLRELCLTRARRAVSEIGSIG
jgi:hypothetical protein